MTGTARMRRRVLRRETHSSRSRTAVVVALLAVVALAWVATEGVLALLGSRPLLMTPAAMLTGIEGLPAAPAAVLVVAGAVIAVAGVALVLVAVLPGRRGRRVLVDERAAVVVDDRALASALVREATSLGGADPDHAVATVGARTAVVRITPTSGVAFDRDAVTAALTRRLAAVPLTPPLRPRITLTKEGRVGA